MRSTRTMLWMAVIAVIALASGASAATTTVDVMPPDAMNGWVVATQSADDGSPIAEFVLAGPGQGPAGSGCFHFFTDILTGSDPLEKIYLGTNNHAGVALNDITSFKYYTYVDSRRYDGEGGSPDGQPPMIELITDSGESTQQRMFLFRPWGWWGGHRVAKDTWQEWDLMATDDNRYWQMMISGSTNVWGNWNWLKTRYPGTMRIATPFVGDYTQGYLHAPTVYDLGNQAGTGISIRVGSGKAVDKIYNPDTLAWVNPWSWWRESCGIDAYADKLVIGINGEETVYNFGGEAMTVGIGTGACRDHIMVVGKKNFFFAVFGKVLADPAPTGSEFYLDDGSNKKIRVLAANMVEPGQYYRAKGTLQWNEGTSRYDLLSSAFDIVRVD